MHRVVAPFVLLLALAPAERAQGAISTDTPAVVPHEEFALSFLAERGLGDLTREEIDFEEVLRAEYARLDLGLYDLRFPIEDLAEAESAADLQAIALALLRSQVLFHGWVEEVLGPAKDALSDVKILAKWIEDWNPGRMSKGGERDDRDLVLGLGAKDNVVQAARRFAAWMRGGGPVGLVREEHAAARMLLMPTRPRFLELVCFAGWYYPHLQHVFWTEGLATWLGCRVQGTQVIALQFASPDISKADFELGLPLNYKHPTVLQQHAVHFGTQALFDNYYGDSIPSYLSTGLAMNMVIEQFGEVDTRIEGDLRARFTEAFSAFVPGGNSGGGVLPPENPDGRFRQNKGRDHFLGLLRLSQRNGAERIMKASEKLLHFEIEDDSRREFITVPAPFLGSPAANKELPPKDFQGDYQEFFRAYKSAFCFWLRIDAGGSKAACERAFARLLTSLARAPENGFEDLVHEIYALPLSGSEPDRKVLEGRFLTWLSKQK